MTTTTRAINGYMIREALKRCERQRKNASQMFNPSLYAFNGETKIAPVAIMEQFQVADRNYAKLQELQQRYNQNVSINVRNGNGSNETITLSLAVKLVGGAGRIEKMWSDSIVPKSDRYSRYDDAQPSRSKDTEYSIRQISESDCLNYANQAGQYRSNLVSAIATANTTTFNVEMSDSEYNTLFGTEQTQGRETERNTRE